jgi:hypothetical protein
MTPTFRLYWLRETGCAAGTLTQAAGLPPAIRDRVLALAGEEAGEFALRLPFFDRKECGKQDELLAALVLERAGPVIRAVLGPQTAARDLAATLALTDPVWRKTPSERDPAYFVVWQRVSLALQRWMRDRIAEEYFRDITRYEDRHAAYVMVVYQASHLCHGKPRTEFTYDLGDYPERQTTVAASWRMIGRQIQNVLRRAEKRLYEAGRDEIAHRYAPVWYQDVLNEVRKKPREYVELLAAESAVIDAVIDLGTERSAAAVNRFARSLGQNLRNVRGMDVRGLGTGLLEEATRALTQSGTGGRDDPFHGGTLQDRGGSAAWSPQLRIAA